MILAVAGLKGGQGRSAIVARLGVLLAGLGHRVVVVDLAPTATASLLLGASGGAERGSGALLAGVARGRELAQPTGLHPGLSLIPADEALLQLESLPAREPSRSGLPALARAFDFVLLDLPPSACTAASTGARVADWRLVPCAPDESSVAGLAATLRWLDRLGCGRRNLVAVTLAEPRLRAAADAESLVRAAHGRMVLRRAVCRDASWRRHDTVARLARQRTLRGADADLRDVKREILRRIVGGS